jgi:hypothetical protein
MTTGRFFATSFAGIAAALALLAAAATASAQSSDDGTHLGVATCAGDNCHGAVQRSKGSSVAQDEYRIWSQKDKHAQAFKMLGGDRGRLIAANLGLGDPQKAPICLDCHADNVAPTRRGPRFDIADGVGCESCHGGAVGWLGLHVSGAAHAANIAAGMYPTDQPLARAQRCQACHIGNPDNFVTHRIMGAGHPPMPFELDTYWAIEPAHDVIDAGYITRKGRPNDIQFWAVGQAVDLEKRMDLIIDPKNAPHGADPELSLFDCQACHHSMNDLQWRARASTGLGPGRLRLYDASAVMLQVVAARVAPDAAAALSSHLLALHRATEAATPDYWTKVQAEAQQVRKAADALIPILAQHNFDKSDAMALAKALVASGIDGVDLDYSGAQQQTMALESVIAGMKSLGFADDAQIKGLNGALGGLYQVVANDQAYRPDAFAAALRQLGTKLPQQ